MLPTPKSGRKAASPAERTQRQRRHPTPRLNAEMASDTAFQIIADRYLRDLTANHEATCRAESVALHQMRIALTRLRTAILFFSPMIDDPKRARIRGELKWLNRQLGTARDLDVAMERLEAESWNKKRAGRLRPVARALRSARYRRLIESISGWVENGPWSIKKGKQAVQERASPIALYSARKLTRWREKLLKKCRKLRDMGTKKRHRLRLLNKKLCYSIECLEDLFPDKRLSSQQTALKYLRKAQRSLGQLNDDANSQSLAAALQRDGVPAALKFLGPKREKRLIRTAAAAYRKLAALKPFRS